MQKSGRPARFAILKLCSCAIPVLYSFEGEVTHFWADLVSPAGSMARKTKQSLALGLIGISRKLFSSKNTGSAVLMTLAMLTPSGKTLSSLAICARSSMGSRQGSAPELYKGCDCHLLGSVQWPFRLQIQTLQCSQNWGALLFPRQAAAGLAGPETRRRQSSSSWSSTRSCSLFHGVR